MISFPNAKINLGLNILEKRDDGFHNIESVMYPIPLCDALELIPRTLNVDSDKPCRLFLKGDRVSGDINDNLVVKAFNCLKENYDIPPIDIFLLKNIPSQAGLGGGSSDASFMLNLLNSKFNLGCSVDELERYSLSIGSDCPFFIRNTPMFVSGVGNILSPIDIDLSSYSIVVIKPGISISTKEAYAGVIPGRPETQLADLINLGVDKWRGLLSNDFEISLFKSYPKLLEIKRRLYEYGAIYASMSGSGSALYGIFDKSEIINMHFPDCFTWSDSDSIAFI